MSHADRADGLLASVTPDAPTHIDAPRDPAIIRVIDATAEALVVVALLGELVLVLMNVAARIWLHHSFLWTDELARFALSVLAFIGGAVAYRRHDHAFVRVVLDRLPERGRTAACWRWRTSWCCSSAA